MSVRGTNWELSRYMENYVEFTHDEDESPLVDSFQDADSLEEEKKESPRGPILSEPLDIPEHPIDMEQYSNPEMIIERPDRWYVLGTLNCNGILYKGEVVNGVPHGIGTYFFKGEIDYQGVFDYGEIIYDDTEIKLISVAKSRFEEEDF